MSLFGGLSCEEKKQIESLNTQLYLMDREIQRIKCDNEFLRKRYCEAAQPENRRTLDLIGRINCIRSDINTNSEAIKELMDKQIQLGRSIRILADRVDTIRDSQECFEKRLRDLENKSNTFNVIIKTEGDVKVEQ